MDGNGQRAGNGRTGRGIRVGKSALFASAIEKKRTCFLSLGAYSLNIILVVSEKLKAFSCTVHMFYIIFKSLKYQ